jgi:outer membrane protein, heavy metal efflux system
MTIRNRFAPFSSRSALMMIVAGLLSGRLAAQSQPAPSPSTEYYNATQGMTLADAVAYALAHEPVLRAARARVEAARGMREQAGLHPNPIVSLDYRGEPGGTDWLTTASLQWPLDLFRKTGRVGVADRTIAVAEHSVGDRQRLLAADIRAQYGDLLVALRELTVLDALIDTARQQHTSLEGRVREGAAPPLERNLLEVELRRLEAERPVQVGRADVAIIQLKRRLGLSPTDTLTVRDTLEEVVLREMQAPAGTVEPRPEATDDITRRSDIREAESKVDLAQARVDSAHREGRYDMSIVGTYMRMDSGFPQQGLAPDGSLTRVRGMFNYVAVGAMIMLPLRNQNQGAIAAAEAERQEASAERDAVLLAARAELAAARARDANAQRSLALFGPDIRQLARQNVTVMRQTYELGRATVFDVLTEQRRLVDFERAYTNALREAYEARTDLNRTKGGVR